jgi:ketosteroid isomerase-like protein
VASKNVETALAYLEAGLRGDYDACTPLISEGYEWFDRARNFHARTQDELLESMQDDAAWTQRELNVEGVMETTDGTVIVQGSVTASHTGTWCSISATGRRVTFALCDLFKFDAQGRIVSEDCYQDLLGVLTTLGVVQPPAIVLRDG